MFAPDFFRFLKALMQWHRISSAELKAQGPHEIVHDSYPNIPLASVSRDPDFYPSFGGHICSKILPNFRNLMKKSQFLSKHVMRDLGTFSLQGS